MAAPKKKPKAHSGAWTADCIKHTLDAAGFRYIDRSSKGEPSFIFDYGPEEKSLISIKAEATDGAMCFTARRILECAKPTVNQFRRAGSVSIDWGLGGLYWNAREGAFEASISLFACPDFAPPRGAVRFVCHQLWAARQALRELSLPSMPPAPPGPTLADVVGKISKATGVPFQGRPDGTFITRLNAGDGTCGISAEEVAEGLFVFDVIPLAGSNWPETARSLRALSSLNGQFLRGVATMWRGGRIVVRDPQPAPFLALDHPRWPRLVFDHATKAAAAVTRQGKALT